MDSDAHALATPGRHTGNGKHITVSPLKRQQGSAMFGWIALSDPNSID